MQMACGDIPYLTVGWLETLPQDLSRYGELFSRNGFETTFSMGFVDDAELLNALGLWVDDSDLINRYLYVPRRLVAYWTPVIQRIPTSLGVEEFLAASPVPALAAYTERLAEKGFETLGALRHIYLQDAKRMGLTEGHARSLCHIASNIVALDQDLPPMDIPMGEWLLHLNPPMEHYELTLQLEGITKPIELKSIGEEQWERLLMKVGHKRTLRYYAAKIRSYWEDPL